MFPLGYRSLAGKYELFLDLYIRAGLSHKVHVGHEDNYSRKKNIYRAIRCVKRHLFPHVLQLKNVQRPRLIQNSCAYHSPCPNMSTSLKSIASWNETMDIDILLRRSEFRKWQTQENKCLALCFLWQWGWWKFHGKIMKTFVSKLLNDSYEDHDTTVLKKSVAPRTTY